MYSLVADNGREFLWREQYMLEQTCKSLIAWQGILLDSLGFYLMIVSQPSTAMLPAMCLVRNQCSCLLLDITPSR